ncbi:MAG TPA: type VII secretion protein EccB [Streptosporangiaceae bacterium]|nr:type VII secretion protein EccB [Streptosporangiaceae bacterium]
MRSRRDQVQAHAYVVGRLTSALVHGEPDAPQSPMRRTTLGSFGGVMIGALLVAGFLIWGLIFPASKGKAMTAGELIVVKETGARFIYARGELRPVLNWTSAELLLGGKATVQSVPAASLAHIPQGPPVGIAGAPDMLPPAGVVNTGDWLVCADPGAGQARVSLTIGPLAASLTAPVTGAVIVADQDGNHYLLWRSHRLRIDEPWIAEALNLGRLPVIQVSSAWLNAVPAAPDLMPMAVPDLGGPGPDLGGQPTRAGQVLVTRNVGSPSEFYLAVAGGVTPITSAQAAIAITDTATAAAYPGAAVAPVPVSPAAIAGASIMHQQLPDGPPAPATPPPSARPSAGAAPCMAYAGRGGTAPSLVFGRPPAGPAPPPSMPGVTTSPENADLISVLPGGGALVSPQAAPGVSGSSLYLVTDEGVKFPLPTAAAARALGYRAGLPAALPAALLAMLPTGPALDLPAMRG